MNRIEPFKNVDDTRKFFDNWKQPAFESKSYKDNKYSMTTRIRNEFINMYFNNKEPDLYKLRLNWENPNPTKWYVNLFYDKNTFPEMYDLFENSPITLEFDLSYKYPINPPKITLITFKYNIGETSINHGKIYSDGRIEHDYFTELITNKYFDNDNNNNQTYPKSWSPTYKLSDIINELYIEIAVSYQRFGKLMFY